MKGHGGDFETEPHRNQHHADNCPMRNRHGCFAAARKQCGEGGKIRRPSIAVNQRRTKQQHARGQRAKHQIFDPGFRTFGIIPVKRRQHIKRERRKLKTHIERKKIIGRNHHHGARRGKQYQHRKFKFLHMVMPEPGLTQKQHQRRGNQNHQLHILGEGIGDKQPVKRLARCCAK